MYLTRSSSFPLSLNPRLRSSPPPEGEVPRRGGGGAFSSDSGSAPLPATPDSPLPATPDSPLRGERTIPTLFVTDLLW